MRITVLFLTAVLACVGGLRAQDGRIYDTPQDSSPPHGNLPLLAPEVITTTDGFDNFDLGVDNAEPHASTNPQDPLWFFNAFNVNRTHRTVDGHNWVFAVPTFGTGFSMRGDPVTAYDSLGRLYYENMYSATAGGAILGCKVILSADNGATWTSSLTAIDGVDKNWIACDQTAGPYANYVYTTMTSEGGGNFSRSTDSGVSWNPMWTFPEQQLPGMMVAVGPDVLNGNNVSGGCVYVVTNSGPTENSTYTFHRSTDGGVSFTQQSALTAAGYVGTQNTIGRLVINNARTRPYPFIAADNSYGPYRGRLYLVYAANDPPGNGNKPDIFLVHSTDQGLTWSGRVLVNDNSNPTTTNEWFPAIWCDKETGRLYIKWYDMRNDPANQRAWVYGTFTDNGGATFALNQKISNTDFIFPNPACSPNTNCYRGDYDAIASNRLTSLSVWSDFRNGNYGSFAGYLPDFAMLVSAGADTLGPVDISDIFVKVPAVKLYTSRVEFSATVSPAAPFVFDFPDGDSLESYPDSLRLRIRTNGAAPGAYTVTITGAGTNGTPVHRRTISVTVTSASLAVLAPAGGEEWQAGTPQAIRWSSVHAGPAVCITLSRNNGVTYPETLFAATPNDSVETWQVTGPGTTTARIRLTSLSIPTLSATGADNFTIPQPVVTVLAPLGGEIWDPGTTQTVRWSSQFHAGGVNIELSRDGGAVFAETLAAGTADDGEEEWVVTGPPTAGARIRVVSAVDPTAADTSGVFTLYQPALSVLPGWNLVSLPVLVPDRRSEAIFPSAASQAFTFTPEGYQGRDTLVNGEGYWLRFDSSGIIPFSGTLVAEDRVSVPAGWSLLGSLSYAVMTDSIVQEPPGILVALHGYVPGIGYQTNPPLIQPGTAVWIRATSAGELILRKQSAPPFPVP